MVLLLACAGCGTHIGVKETQHLTIEHAFTDAAAAGARNDAERMCARKRLVAVRTSGTCSLTRCTTHFQCMNDADAEKYRP